MSENQWTKVAEEKNLREGLPVVVKVDDKEVLLVRLEEKIYACGNKCTHYGAPLSDGRLSNHIATCPWHNARFNVKNGKMVAPPALDDLPVYPVKVENGDVYLGKAESPKVAKSSGLDKRTVLIVGAGAAGNTAAEALRREGFDGHIQLLTAEPDRPYDRPNLSKEFMAGTAPADWIPLRSEAFYTENQIDLLTNHRVTDLDPVEHSVTLARGKKLHFDQCLLATGGIPRSLDVQGSNLENVFQFRSLQDAQVVVGAVEQASRVLIVGAGFIGMEVAASLRVRNLDVHVVAPEKVPFLHIFGEKVAKRLQKRHEANGVQFHLGTTVKELAGHQKVQEVILKNDTRLSIDVVVIGLGISPAVEYLQKTNLIQDGAVPVNEHLETRAKGIYAAGDIAIVPYGYSGERQRIEHWAVAERQGLHAARAMLGHDEPYDDVPFFWTQQHDVSLKYVGFASQFDQIAYQGDIENGNFLAGYYMKGQLKAAATVGMSKELFAVQEILKTGHAIPFEQFQNWVDA